MLYTFASCRYIYQPTFNLLPMHHKQLYVERTFEIGYTITRWQVYRYQAYFYKFVYITLYSTTHDCSNKYVLITGTEQLCRIRTSSRLVGINRRIATLSQPPGNLKNPFSLFAFSFFRPRRAAQLLLFKQYSVSFNTPSGDLLVIQ